MTEPTITINDIAALTGKTARSVQRWASAEGWPHVNAPNPAGNGRPVRAYLLAGLPDEVRRLYNKDNVTFSGASSSSASDIGKTAADAGLTSPRSNQLPPQHPHQRPGAAVLPFPTPETTGLSAARLKKGWHKADLLRLYLEHLDRAGYGSKAAAREDFMTVYNSGIAYPILYDAVGPVSWKTIEGWKKSVERAKGDTTALAERRGQPARGHGDFTEEQQDILVRCMLHPNRPKIAEVIRLAHAVMDARGLTNGHSDATYRRWIADWRDRNYPVWVFHRRGEKAWNDDCAYYIERDYNLINVGDIIVADGHVLNFEIINPWTGKPKRMILILWYDMKSSMPLGWEIMPTEDTAAISSALRRALITLGKIPKAVYLDNGRAFRARFFAGCPSFEECGLSGLYERLGCKTIFAWPYHGQSKTIERFFGSLAELERWMPTYTGTSIDAKPPRMNRGERLHRKIHEASPYANGITLADAHRAIAAWFDEYARRPQQSGHLKGIAPVELFSEGRGPGLPADDLNMLMMAAEIRHIRRNGINFLGQNYYAPELYGRRRPVVIRYDLQDDSALHVYEPDGAYLCLAQPVEKIHPAANALGSEADQDRLKKHIAIKNGQKKQASAYARRLLADEIMPEHQARLERLGVDGTGAPGGQPVKPAAPLKLTAAEAGRIAAEAAAMEAETSDTPAADAEIIDLPEVITEADELAARLDGLSDPDRYEALLELEARATLTEQHRAFMRYFELTDVYLAQADYYEERRALMAVMWQRSI